MAGLQPYIESQVMLGSPAMKEPNKNSSMEPSRLNWKFPWPSEDRRASSPHTLTNIYYRDPKKQEPWKAMENSGQCGPNPETPGESRGCFPLSPNYRT
ncbi:hypothetical protein TNCV_469311 [Trichonephila clavipes]|nr:hypothetical protein TNCV_469311 [Trichonephila clavipes]